MVTLGHKGLGFSFGPALASQSSLGNTRDIKKYITALKSFVPPQTAQSHQE